MANNPVYLSSSSASFHKKGAINPQARYETLCNLIEKIFKSSLIFPQQEPFPQNFIKRLNWISQVMQNLDHKNPKNQALYKQKLLDAFCPAEEAEAIATLATVKDCSFYSYCETVLYIIRKFGVPNNMTADFNMIFEEIQKWCDQRTWNRYTNLLCYSFKALQMKQAKDNKLGIASPNQLGIYTRKEPFSNTSDKLLGEVQFAMKDIKFDNIILSDVTWRSIDIDQVIITSSSIKQMSVINCIGAIEILKSKIISSTFEGGSLSGLIENTSLINVDFKNIVLEDFTIYNCNLAKINFQNVTIGSNVKIILREYDKKFLDNQIEVSTLLDVAVSCSQVQYQQDEKHELSCDSSLIIDIMIQFMQQLLKQHFLNIVNKNNSNTFTIIKERIGEIIKKYELDIKSPQIKELINYINNYGDYIIKHAPRAINFDSNKNAKEESKFDISKYVSSAYVPIFRRNIGNSYPAKTVDSSEFLMSKGVKQIGTMNKLLVKDAYQTYLEDDKL